MLIKDSVLKYSSKIDEDTGFLKLRGAVARSGIQEYYGYELGLEGDASFDTYNLYRPDAVVFSDETLKTFESLPVTNNHPSAHLSVENIKDNQTGMFTSPKIENGLITGSITLTDLETIADIRQGKKLELSVGYKSELEQQKGVAPDGTPYDFIVKSISANHLALVESGRAGDECRLIDNKGQKKMSKIKLNDVDFEVEDQLKQAVESAMVKLQDSIVQKEKEITQLKKEKDTLQGEKDAIQSAQLSDSDIKKLIKSRTLLVDQASKIVDSDLVELSDNDIKKQVIVKIFDHKHEELKDKSSDYIDALYSGAIKINDSRNKTNGGIKGAGKKVATPLTKEVSARDKYINSLKGN